MALLIANCTRCGAEHMTFDVKAQAYSNVEFGWAFLYEVFSVCRSCNLPSIFLVRLNDLNAGQTFGPGRADALSSYQGSLNTFFDVLRPVSLRDEHHVDAPEFLPDDIRGVFDEGAACLATGCVNAAATMFRLCVDLATLPLLPAIEDGKTPDPPHRVRRDLGLRLPWLFENGLLPAVLADLATAIKEDGNDGAHRASLTEADAQDVLDFTIALLDRLISEPRRLEEAKARRAERRKVMEQAQGT